MSSARALRWRARAFVGVCSIVCLRVSPRAAQHEDSHQPATVTAGVTAPTPTRSLSRHRIL